MSVPSLELVTGGSQSIILTTVSPPNRSSRSLTVAPIAEKGNDFGYLPSLSPRTVRVQRGETRMRRFVEWLTLSRLSTCIRRGRVYPLVHQRIGGPVPASVDHPIPG
jgi:hypothetical protein